MSNESHSTRPSSVSGASTASVNPGTPSGTAPILFVAHGAPPLLDDPTWVAELSAWGKSLGKPKAILMLSAHWDERPLAIGATTAIPLIYDFYGFPRRFYELQYPSPGAPALADRVRDLLRAAAHPFVESPKRGLDHGAYIPLMCMYPDADIPVLQVSLPGLEPARLLALGRILAPLRDEGVMIFGSGFLTHNMRALGGGTPAWASEFDGWCADVLARHDLDALVGFLDRGPGARIALPTTEHFVPVLVSAGAAAEREASVRFPITGFAFGSFTKRSVEFG